MKINLSLFRGSELDERYELQRNLRRKHTSKNRGASDGRTYNMLFPFSSVMLFLICVIVCGLVGLWQFEMDGHLLINGLWLNKWFLFIFGLFTRDSYFITIILVHFVKILRFEIITNLFTLISTLQALVLCILLEKGFLY